MNKIIKNTKKLTLFEGLLFTVLLVMFGFFTVKTTSNNLMSITAVSAEDEEEEEEEKEEYEDEEEDDDRDEDDDYRKNSSIQEEEVEEIIIYESADPQETVTELVPEKRFINVVDLGYDVDTDGDQLVDAIDPDPYVHQKEFYTDSDGDSVPDVFDEYPDEDDFLYIEFEDTNQNGVVDYFESQQ